MNASHKSTDARHSPDQFASHDLTVLVTLLARADKVVE